jgi:starch synthase
VVVPGYRGILSRRDLAPHFVREVGFPYAGDEIRGRALSIPRGRVTVLLLDQPSLFDRQAVYGENGTSYGDNGLRFGWFAGAALEVLSGLDAPPDAIFAHDWPAALAPVFMRTHTRFARQLDKTASLLTVHNLAHQGLFPLDLARGFDIPEIYLGSDGLEAGGLLNMLKGGIVSATRVITVSPTYAREIVRPDFGEGLHRVLLDRGADLSGVLNGIDVAAWDPQHDPHLPAPFSAARPAGKESCKAALQHECGLREIPDLPLFGVVSRIDRQKGIDLVEQVAPELIEGGAQLVILGSGVPGLLDPLHGLAHIWRESVAIYERFDEALARRIYAGADFFLMPSRFEPCGLGQMVALRYGALPVVRRTGGLADTVEDLTAHPEEGTGFVFETADSGGLSWACGQALALYEEGHERFVAARRRAMEQDFSWRSSAAIYDALAEDAIRTERRRVWR